MKRILNFLFAFIIAILTLSLFACENGDDKSPDSGDTPHSHSYGGWIVEIPASCESAGTLGHYACSCGKNFDLSKNELADIAIAPLGHTSENGECTSCGYLIPLDDLEGDELIMALNTRSNNRMNALSSYKMDGTFVVSYTMFDSPVNAEIASTFFEYGVGTDSYVSFRKVQTNFDVIDVGISSVEIEEYGYKDGYMYLTQDADGEKVVLRSPVTVDDFLLIKKREAMEISELLDPFMFSCLEKSAKKQADGSWKISLGSYTGEAILGFEKIFGEMLYTFPTGVSIADVSFEITLNKNLTIADTNFNIEFESSDASVTLPSISGNLQCSEYDAVVLPSEMFAGDARDVNDLGAIISAFDAWTEGQISGNLTYSAELVTNISGSKSTSTYSASCSDGADGFKYQYESLASGTASSMSYENGIRTVVQGGESAQYDSDDQTEKILFTQYSDPLGLDRFYVLSCSEVEQDGKTVYTMKMSADGDTFIQQLKDAYGYEFENVDITVIFTVEDGFVTNVEYVNSSDILYSGYSFPMTVVCTASYTYAEA